MTAAIAALLAANFFALALLAFWFRTCYRRADVNMHYPGPKHLEEGKHKKGGHNPPPTTPRPPAPRIVAVLDDDELAALDDTDYWEG